MHRVLPLALLILAVVLPPLPARADDPGPTPIATMEREIQKTVHHVAVDKRREFIATFFATHEHRHLYGPDLSNAFDVIGSVSPDQVDAGVVKYLEGIIKKYGCGEIFEQMANMAPAMRAYEFAAACPPKGDRAVEPDLAANTPLAYLLTAATMEAHARAKGFNLSPLHRHAVGLLLTPRTWLDSTYIVITISTDAIWVDNTRVAHLTCKGDPDDNKARCKRILKRCAQDSTADGCADSKLTLKIAGEKEDKKMSIPKVAEAVKKRAAEIRGVHEKLEREPELQFTLFVDRQIPYKLLTRTIYSATEDLPEKERGNSRFQFYLRPPEEEFHPRNETTPDDWPPSR